MTDAPVFIRPDWPATMGVRVITTTRTGGGSAGDYGGFNLAAHVGDDPARVAGNRRELGRVLALPAQPAWLEQVHGDRIVSLEAGYPGEPADGSLTRRPGRVCAVLTADCLPVVLAARDGSAVAVLHAGWRGLVAGILEAGVRQLAGAGELLGWLGPAIGPERFEVGGEVVEQLARATPGPSRWRWPGARPGKWQVDLYAVARQRLLAAGVSIVSGGDWCTFSDSRRFFSYRRQGQCGRMATLAWLDPSPGSARSGPA